MMISNSVIWGINLKQMEYSSGNIGMEAMAHS